MFEKFARSIPWLVLASFLVPTAWGEDIDLYVSGANSMQAPNVLFFIDNTSNWSENSQKWTKASVLSKCDADKSVCVSRCKAGDSACQSACETSRAVCAGYAEKVFDTSSDLLQGQVELRALKLVLNELVCNAPTDRALSVNVGLMLFNDQGTVDSQSGITGYIRQAIAPLSTLCSTLVPDLETIDNKITTPDFKGPSSADYGSALYEAFKYFGGYSNPAQTAQQKAGAPPDSTHFGPIRFGRPTVLEDPSAQLTFTDSTTKTTYKSPITSDNGCGKNYLILIGNKFPNQEPNSDTNQTPPSNLVLNRLGYNASQIYPVPLSSSDKTDVRFADEWAQFLATTDVSDVAGKQPVFTYTVNVYNKTADTKQRALLHSMASNGGTGEGGYFEVGGNLKTLIDALKDVLTQIGAVNGVFASASLPVSVNTQGTYLNQVFIGMFRPDADARPRWAGNLKQYQFKLTSDGKSLFLADMAGNAAVDNANTGFIGNCANSFWTTDSGTYWQNVPLAQTPASTCTSSANSVYSDAPDGDIVEKGAAGEKLRRRSTSRTIKTCASAATTTVVDLDTSNVTSLGADVVNWVRGSNTGDGPSANGSYQFYNMATTAVRPTVHGEVVHSRPLAINYGSGTTDDVVVFYGAGDGTLRAIDGNQTTANAGDELWAFVAPEFFERFPRLRENSPLISYPTVSSSTDPKPIPKDYFFDGAIGAYQERATDGTVSKLYLYPAMRRGGRVIYAFEATKRPSSLAPSLLWKFGCPHLSDDTDCTGTDAAKIGQTWSTPRVIRLKNLKDQDGQVKLYLVFGGGYDTCDDGDVPTCTASSKGTGIFVLDAEKGTQVAYIDLTALKDNGKNAITAGRVVADIVPVDVNFDGFVDVLYAADTRGNVWRINTSDLTNAGEGKAPSLWTTYRLAYVSDWSDAAQSRKFLYPPDVVTVGSTNIVLMGSGDREHPLATASAAKVRNRFYGLRDAYGSAPSDIKGIDCDASGDTILDSNCDLLNVTDTTKDYSTAVLGARGWVFDLATVGSTSVNEQVVTAPVTVGGATYFSTYQATTDNATKACTYLGTARGYAVNFLTGGLRAGDTSRDAEFKGGGLPPTPVAGIVLIKEENGEEKKVPFILGGKPPPGGGGGGAGGGGGDGLAGSPLEGNKVPIPIQQVRKKVYRFLKVDP